MKRITSSLLLGSSLLTTLPAHAGEWLQWHGESLTYLYGKDFKVNPRIQQTITFEHANKWKYGDTFMFVDKIFYNGQADASKGVTTYYGEFSHACRSARSSTASSLSVRSRTYCWP